MEAKVSSTMLAPTCPTGIPSFHIKLTLRLPFEDSLVSRLFLCLRLKFILLIAYINFKHCHILCCLDFILIPFCSNFLKASERKVVYGLSVALTSHQPSKTQATRCVTALIFSVYQTHWLYWTSPAQLQRLCFCSTSLNSLDKHVSFHSYFHCMFL